MLLKTLPFAALVVLSVWQPVSSFAQTRAETAAAILARVDSPANWTHRQTFDSGSVTIIGGRPQDGPFGPLELGPIAPLSRQPYAYWPEPFYGYAPTFSHRYGASERHGRPWTSAPSTAPARTAPPSRGVSSSNGAGVSRGTASGPRR